jgi:DNA repair protein RadC
MNDRMPSKKPSAVYEQLSMPYLVPLPPTQVSKEDQKQLRALHRALKPYVDIDQLRVLVARGESLQSAVRGPHIPEEIQDLLRLFGDLVAPDDRRQIKSPADAAALLMVEMGHLDQEHLRTVLLDIKNRVDMIQTIYIGSVNCALIRVGEVFKEALRRNSAALILAHNHPSGDPSPSPEDILITRQIVEAGKLLDCEVLDHLVIGRGRYVSMRSLGLGFTGM